MYEVKTYWVTAAEINAEVEPILRDKWTEGTGIAWIDYSPQDNCFALKQCPQLKVRIQHAAALAVRRRLGLPLMTDHFPMGDEWEMIVVAASLPVVDSDDCVLPEETRIEVKVGRRIEAGAPE